MNTSNIVLSSAGSVFLGEAVNLVHTQAWLAIACAVVGILCWVGYDYLP